MIAFIKNIKNKTKNEEGSTTLMYVVLLLAVVVAIIGFMQILRESFIYREVNTAMDVAGIAALRGNVDDEKLRVEEFWINEEQARRDYMMMMDESLANINHILDYRFQKTEISRDDDDWKLGITHKDHGQYTLKSVIIVRLKTNPYLDTIPRTSKRFYDARGDKNFEVQFVGVGADGVKEMAIYNTTRIVYR